MTNRSGSENIDVMTGIVSNQKGIVQLIILLVVVVGVVLGVVLSQNPQIFRPKAANAPIEGSENEATPPNTVGVLPNGQCDSSSVCANSQNNPAYTGLGCRLNPVDPSGRICRFNDRAQDRGTGCLSNIDCKINYICSLPNGEDKSGVATARDAREGSIQISNQPYCLNFATVPPFSSSNGYIGWDEYKSKRDVFFSAVSEDYDNMVSERVYDDLINWLGSVDVSVIPEIRKDKASNSTCRYLLYQARAAKDSVVQIFEQMERIRGGKSRKNMGNYVSAMAVKLQDFSYNVISLLASTQDKSTCDILPIPGVSAFPSNMDLNKTILDMRSLNNKQEEAKKQLKDYLGNRACFSDAECVNRNDNKAARVAGGPAQYVCAPDVDVNSYAAELTTLLPGLRVYRGCNMPTDPIPE